MNDLLGHLSAAGRERILLPRAPERLGAGKRVLVVVDGVVDVRGVPLSKGKAWGPREPLFVLSPGEAFWDIAVDEEMDYALELTARDRARLIELSWEEMEASLSEPSCREALGAMAESFLEKFGRWLARSVPPRQTAPERAGGPGNQTFFADSTLASPEGEIRWALLKEGDVSLLGEESIGASALFIGEALWLRGFRRALSSGFRSRTFLLPGVSTGRWRRPFLSTGIWPSSMAVLS